MHRHFFFFSTFCNFNKIFGRSLRQDSYHAYVFWKSWNVLDFCNDNFQAWKVLENEIKSRKTAGKIERLDKTPPFAENYPLSHVIRSVRQALFSEI